MKILALSDEVVPHVYSAEARQRYHDVDLIAGCGDLPASYLEYVVSTLNVPLVYVPGNHDPDSYRVQGGIRLDGAFARVRGIALAGFGGSARYKADGRNQYSEMEMHLRLIPLLPRLLLRRLRLGHGADVLLTHAPPRDVHDDRDPAHRGFQAFRWLIRATRPRWMLHGHVHIWADLSPRESVVDGCRVVNIFPAQVIEVEAR